MKNIRGSLKLSPPILPSLEPPLVPCTGRRKCAAWGQHSRDEDWGGQNPSGNPADIPECTHRKGRACGHSQWLSSWARWQLVSECLCMQFKRAVWGDLCPSVQCVCVCGDLCPTVPVCLVAFVFFQSPSACCMMTIMWSNDHVIGQGQQAKAWAFHSLRRDLLTGLFAVRRCHDECWGGWGNVLSCCALARSLLWHDQACLQPH